MPNIFEQDLAKTAANYAVLSPVSFLARSAHTYPDRLAIIHGQRRFTWEQYYRRCCKVASALACFGIGSGNTVAVMAANTPEMLELHFAVPMSQGVLNTLNTRLDAATLGFMLEHAEAKIIFCDREFAGLIKEALTHIARKIPIIDINDSEYQGAGQAIGFKDYESFLQTGADRSDWPLPPDEWQAISVNYTSGTTGNPKGVVYHHRGAYLNAVNNIVAWNMPPHPVLLWTLPMFHCNGWCFPWTMAAAAGTNICLRRIEASAIFAAIREHKVTNYCGAPIVHSLLINAPDEMREGIHHPVHALVAGAAPPAAVIEGMEKIGFDLTHVYGLTETYGPAAICAKQESWSKLSLSERAERNGRQGVSYQMQEQMTVIDPETMQEVPRDGETMGEVMFRGNITMKGYLKNPTATAEAFRGGWFHSGDLGVLQTDGYVKIKDRSKDVIISGGENISSLEVEDALSRHPLVLFSAVVAMPDPKWGEIPCAFVELKQGAVTTETEIIEFCRTQLARFKAPKKVIFGELPKTSTGKIQKFLLRERVHSTDAIE